MGKTYLHPNPAFGRDEWESLNGEWEFAFDGDRTLSESSPFPLRIRVPYTYETRASGIGTCDMCERIWYRRNVRVRPHGGSVLLRFEGVDYRAEIFVNGQRAGGHTGGYTAFALDITALVRPGDNTLAVMVEDSYEPAQLRGKQRSGAESRDCWYVQTTGIWKDVYLEYAGATYFREAAFQTSPDGAVVLKYSLNRPGRVRVEGGGVSAESAVVASEGELTFRVARPELWCAENPRLYEAGLYTDDDAVSSYFAFRTVGTNGKCVTVNGRPVYLKMILDQGYWRDTGLTPPSVAAMEEDIRFLRECGFNGVRMHQKVESAQFYYLCDRAGVYVFGEIPSCYAFNPLMREEFLRDAPKIVRQLSPHPSVVAWVAFNESWGIPLIREDPDTQRFVNRACAAMLAEGAGRLMIKNDGWHQLDSDILSLHEYQQDGDRLYDDYRDKGRIVTDHVVNGYGQAFAHGYRYAGQPVMISEFGGIALRDSPGWGYGDKADSLAVFVERMRRLFRAINDLDYLCGYCYTQLTDVQQETNGLLYEDHTPKIPAEQIRRIMAGEEVRIEEITDSRSIGGGAAAGGVHAGEPARPDSRDAAV